MLMKNHIKRKKEKYNLKSYWLLMHVNMKLPPGAANE